MNKNKCNKENKKERLEKVCLEKNKKKLSVGSGEFCKDSIKAQTTSSNIFYTYFYSKKKKYNHKKYWGWKKGIRKR